MMSNYNNADVYANRKETYSNNRETEVKAAIYCRLSKDDDIDGESESIQNQKLILQKYADEHHFLNTRFYIDM